MIASARKQIDPGDTEALVNQMLEQGRYAFLLRPQLAEGLDDRQYERTVEALKDGMALVPDGQVIIGKTEIDGDEGRFARGTGASNVKAGWCKLPISSSTGIR